MKKYILTIFFVFTSFVFADGFQSKEERINAIDKEIETLMLKRANLELLKEKIQNSNSDQVIEGKIKKTRPTIALVLSGGGAKGAAHIGVLKVLQKYQVPIDIVVGTSVGSIVGGMYAIGYTPEEIEKMVFSLDFVSLFNNSKDRKLKNIEEKTINDLYPFTITIDKDMNLSLPMGFTNGEKIYLQLKKIFAPAEGVDNFNDFPMKFRAITTNLNTGEQVILKNGDLALSTLKSMAIPSFVEPVDDNNKFYVDGGVTNNFPIDVALKMGADIIIAVDISADETKITENSSVISILDKISTYNGNRNTQFQKQLADILIVPKVQNHDTLDFDGLGKLVIAGETAATQYGYLFKNLQDPAEYNAIHSKQLKPRKLPIKNIKLEGNEILTLNKVKSLEPKVKDEDFGENELLLWARKIYAIPYIEKVFYEVDGDTITFKVVEKTGINIKAAINYSTQYGGAINLAATMPNFGRWTKNYTATAEISQYPKLSLNSVALYEINNFKVIGATTIGFETNPLFAFKGKDNVATFRSDTFKANMSLATSFDNSFIGGISLGYENTDVDYLRGDKSITSLEDNYQLALFQAYLFLDTLDHPFFPTKGVSLLLDQFNGKRLDEGYYNGYRFNFNYYYPLTKKFSVNFGTASGKVYGEDIPDDKLFKIGGLATTSRYISFVGLPMMGVFANEFYSTSVGFSYTLAQSLHLIGQYNVLTYGSKGLVFQNNQQAGNEWKHGYGVGIGWDTFLGPISFMVSNNVNSSAPMVELYLGYIF